MSDTKKTVWDRFIDFGKGWGLMITITGLIIGLGVKFETRTFSSDEMKYETEKHIKEGPTAEQTHRDRILDSINNVEAIKSRKMRDSIFKLSRIDQQKMLENQKKSDSISRLNADQIYQMKEELKNN